MTVAGSGLFNAEMMESIYRGWQGGGTAILFVRLKVTNSETAARLSGWENEEPGLIWRQRLDRDCFYCITSPAADMLVGDYADKAVASLRKALLSPREGDEGQPHPDPANGIAEIGVAVTEPVDRDESEAEVYRAWLSAMKSSSSIGGYEPVLTEAPDSPRPRGRLIGQLAANIHQFHPDVRVSEIAYLFNNDASAQGAVIVKDWKPVGLVMKEKLHQLLAGQYGLPLYWSKKAELVMDTKPLVVDSGMSVEQVSQLAMARNYSQLYDVVLITEEERLLGAASIRTILESLTAQRTEEARTANPLTGLPGNEDIIAEMMRMLAQQRPKAMIYADLDYFKWFNDCFGFSAGDELIRYVAKLLSSKVYGMGGADPFVGHIGGDDFIAIADAEFAEEICRSLIDDFDEGVKRFYRGRDVQSVEDRQGQTVQQQGVTLSLAILLWDGKEPATPEEMSRYAAMLKKRAKGIKGSVYVAEFMKAAGSLERSRHETISE